MLSTSGFETTFRWLTGNEPYDYQRRVAEKIFAGRNLVLRAPTGAGKTWAVVAPFLHSIEAQRPIADRLLYALPLRSLATSLYRDTCDSIAAASLKSGSFTGSLVDVRIQTGEQKEDPFFDGQLTFTTIDQLLSSYLLNPLSLPKRVGNINAGALLGSLIVFDEYHLLEAGKSMATSIEMLDRLISAASLAQFVLMTATLSTQTIAWLADKLKADTVELSAEEIAALPSHRNKKRRYRWVSGPLSVENVIAQHRAGRTIVLVNSVSRAQQIYEELTADENRRRLGGKTQFALLHSRFYAEDRQRTEATLALWFGPKPKVTDVILVTTQVIEAGMDLSCDNLHTELAPMNALIQRAGRCARRPNSSGTVWIYELQMDEAGKPRLGPYKDLAEIIQQTRDQLERLDQSGPILDYCDEMRLVNAVHTAQELAALAHSPVHVVRENVHRAMDGASPTAVRDLVRDVSSVNVVITSCPEELRFDRRQWPRFLSVPPTSLYTLQDALKNPGASGWVVKEAVECDINSGVLSVNWPIVDDPKKLSRLGWLVAIHPDHATYDPQLGLLLGRRGPDRPPEYRDRPQTTRYSYRYETYETHVERVIAAAKSQAPKYEIARSRLAVFYNSTPGEVEEWVSLTCALHDVGKLATKWQAAIWRWQSYKDKQSGHGERPQTPLAHSDYDPATDYPVQKDYPRPPHAAEGAYATLQALLSFFRKEKQGIAKAILSSIARHHGTWTTELEPFQIPADATARVKAMLPNSWKSIDLRLLDDPSDQQRGKFSRSLVHFTEPPNATLWPLYTFLVRRLRLADQASMRETD